MSESVLIDNIRTDGGTQTRTPLWPEIIKEYSEAYEANEALPPVVVFNDGEYLWLADGFHRLAGSRRARRKEINAEIREGSRKDALLFSAGCNGAHGLRRSNEDKRHAVKLILEDPELAKQTDRWIAEQCHVSHPLVAEVRSHFGNSSNTQAESRQGRDGRSYKARKQSQSGGKSEADKTTKKREQQNGAMKFDWPPFHANFGALYRQIDKFGNSYECNKTPAAEDLRRTLGEWMKRFKDWTQEISKLKPPAG